MSDIYNKVVKLLTLDVRAKLADSDSALVSYGAQVGVLKQRVDSFGSALYRIRHKHKKKHDEINGIDDGDLGYEFESKFSEL